MQSNIIIIIIFYTITLNYVDTVDTPLRQLVLSSSLPVEYDSGASVLVPGGPLSGCVATVPQPICSPGTLVINDGDNGPLYQNLSDVAGVLAWNQDVTVIVSVITPISVIGINLFFYNNPSVGVGLPHEIELAYSDNPLAVSNPLGHAVLGNQDLNEDDNVLRNATVAVVPSGNSPSYTSIGITFRFSELNRIRWLLLSEIEICTDNGIQCDLTIKSILRFLSFLFHSQSPPLPLTQFL